MPRRIALLLLLSVLPHAAAENPATPAPEVPATPAITGRFAAEISAFAAETPATGGIVFTGSSSIRRWPDLQATFPDLPVVNRGFGGCHVTDVADRFEIVIARHQPKLIVIYAGGNDLAEGKSVAATFAATTRLIEQSRTRLPDARIVLLSLKIAPLRAHLAPRYHELNQRLKSWSTGKEHLRWVDAGSCLAIAASEPDPAVFDADRLHLNAAGYARWKTLLDPILREEWARADRTR